MSKDFSGLKTGRLSNGVLFLDYLLEVGPRLVRAGFLDDLQNLLAETPDLHWDTPHGRYHPRGGHRLWHAPEHSDRTHIPDDDPPLIERDGSTLILKARPEKPTRIQKSMQVTIPDNQASLVIDHTLTNCSQAPAELAVWPITQLPLGGVFILPLSKTPVDSDGKLPNRNLVLWPYSRLQDTRIHFEEDVLLLEGADLPPDNKIGMFNRAGWLAYLRGRILLIKHFSPHPGKKHVDMGCNMEIYLSGMFVEMETLSPWERFEPGESISHRESWTLHRLDHHYPDATAVLRAFRSGELPLPNEIQPASFQDAGK